jgi:DNA-directed RNA polymerases I, II, and III subunit RPABC4
MAEVPIEGEEKPYQCGECKSIMELGPRDPLRCKDCGHRIFYKPRREKTWNQYYAR